MTADTVGGVWHYALELARSVGGSGVRVALASMGAPLSALQREQAAKLPNVALFESTYKLEWMPDPWRDVSRAGAWLLELEDQLKPDIVHLNQYAFGALPFRAPKLVVAHSCVLSWWRAVNGCAAPAECDRYRTLVQRGLAGAAVVAAPTRAMLLTLAENYGYRERGLVVANGRDAASYRPGRKAPVILAAGRLWDCAKNLAALEAVAPKLPWPVRVAGATAQPGGGVREARGVQALGELAPEALANEMAGAAIYALPARYEPFGLSVLEAALSGCALVLGDIPSLREVWGRTVLFVRPDDPGALRDAILRLIRDQRLRERLARAARARGMTYTAERKASAYLAIYEALAGRARGVSMKQALFAAGSRACAS
jgi:glycosyltransferase involved in cell wall biosynthesis